MKSLSVFLRSLLLAFAVILVLTVAACGEMEQGSDPLIYLHEPFTAEVRGELRGIAFTGVLAYRSAANGGQEFHFTAPATLAGITVRRAGEGEQILLSLGDICIPTSEWETSDLRRLLLPLTRGRVISSTTGEEGGTSAVIEVAGVGTYTVKPDENGSPPFWECDGMWMEVKKE